MNTFRRHLLAAAACFTACVSWGAAAQGAFPDRPVKIIVPFPPGGSFDVIARGLSIKLGELWKQPVIIENRAGAGGNIGAKVVISAPADGYTLLLWGDGVLANPLLYAKVPFDAIRDLSGVALLAKAPQVLVSSEKSNLTTMKDVLGAREALNYGTAGTGSPGHLAAELMKREGAKQLNHIAYRGGGPALSDLMGNQIQLVSTGLPACMGLIRSGRIKAVAVSSAKRMKILPQVPTVGETLPGYEVDTWYGLMAPKATPVAIRNKIAADVKTVLLNSELQERLSNEGFEVATSTPAELEKKMINDLAFWRVQVAKSGAHSE
ncbi:MAG: tripartite tricarboxylate transporter substrate binding protein [Polaromonas sp.]